MSDIVVTLEGVLISQNHNLEHSSDIENETAIESENDHMCETDQWDEDRNQDSIPSPTTLEQDSGNMVQKKKRSKGNIGKAFLWSLGIFTKKKKKEYFLSGSESTNERSLLDNMHVPCRLFTIEEITAAINNFDRNPKLGEGGFGTVYRGWVDNGTLEVTVKCRKILDSNKLRTYRVEIEAHSQLRHLNVIPLVGYCSDKGQLMLVYNYMVNKSLYDHLYPNETGTNPLPWEKRLEICIGAAKGLQYLHCGTINKIIHRDIKPSNIFLDENWVAKISDFEFSKVVEPDCTDATTTVAGTFGYLDPEYIHRLRLTEKSDVYAFGVVLLEVVSGRKPYEYSLDEEQRLLVDWFRVCLSENKIDQIIDPYLIGRISPECLMQYLKIALFCVLEKGNSRPTMNYVVESLEIALQLQQPWYIGDDIDSLDWLPAMVGHAYNNVFVYQYGRFFDIHLDTNKQTTDTANTIPSNMQDNEPSYTNLSFTIDVVNNPYLGLSMPLR